MNTTWAVVKIRPKTNSGPYGIWTHDLCDIGAALYQLSKQANRGLVIVMFSNKPWSDESVTVNVPKSYMWMK